MWFFDLKDIPEIAKGASELVDLLKKGEVLKLFDKIKTKLIAYVRFSIWSFVIFWIVWICHCAKPDGGKGTCIIGEDSGGSKNTKTINMKEFFGAGLTPTDNNYENGGQRTNWFDTGFVTNGKNLVIYVSGEYFPWGKKQTERQTGYHMGVAKTEDGDFETTLKVTDDYTDCVFNTDATYYNNDTEQMRLAYDDHLTQYTGQNKNNRQTGVAYALAQHGIQSDCIVGNNCFGNQTITSTSNVKPDGFPVGCVLKNGAGIYMRIGGNDVQYAYHLKNSYVPLLEKYCPYGKDATCEWKYKDKSITTNVQVAQVPFGLPIQIYEQDKADFKIFIDIRENLMKNLTPITNYLWKEDQLAYKFTTLEKVKNGKCEDNGLKDDTKYQTINDYCYQSVTKTMTNAELTNHSCPQADTTDDILHPDELCAPVKGKRIYIKPADTFYEDDEGQITLVFASGADNLNKTEETVSFSKNGFKLSWIQNILYTLIEPVWGAQVDQAPPEELIKMQEPSLDDNSRGKRTFCHKNGKNLYITKYRGNWLVKTGKFASSGLLIKTNDETILTTEKYTMEYKLKDRKDCVVLTTINSEDIGNIKRLKGVAKEGFVGYLIQIDNIQDGLFMQIRDGIIKSGHFNIARVLIAVWFVFSFGLGVIGQYKGFSMAMLTVDWKRFLICMWATDYKNYEFIDEMLWPTLFHTSEILASLIFEAGADLFGFSLNPDNPYEYFDNIISMVTSKEVLLKLFAIATNPESGASLLFVLPINSYCLC